MADPISLLTAQLASTQVGGTELNFDDGNLRKMDNAQDAKEIVDSIEKCAHLQSLRLSGNTIGIEAAEAIAKALETHPEFEKALWSDMFTSRLRSEIPPALEHFSVGLVKAGAQLKELDLSDNAFGGIGVQGFLHLLKSPCCHSLEVLRVNNCGLGGGATMLADALLEMHAQSQAAGKPLALKVFQAGRNRIEDANATPLADAFKTIGTLEEISIIQNGIYHEGISALASSFGHNPNLKVINLNDNTLLEKGASSLAKVLPSLKCLEVLNFGDALVKTKGALVLAKALTGNLPSLKELDLSHNQIQMEGAMAVVKSLHDKRQFKMLDLNGNVLNEEEIDEILDELKRLDLVDVLGSISDCESGDDEEDEGDSDSDQEEENVTEIPITIEEFLDKPNAKCLHALGSQAPSKLMERIGDEACDARKACLVLAKISKAIADNTLTVACDCADKLLEAAFTKQKNGSRSFTELTSEILIQLRVLKSEDKPEMYGDPEGLMQLLAFCAGKPYFAASTKGCIREFLNAGSIEHLTKYSKDFFQFKRAVYQ